MFIDRFNRQDRRIFTVAVLLLTLSFTLSIFDDWVYTLTQKDLGDLEEIGTVTLAKKDVRRRYQVAFGWTPLKQENAVYQGDSIFTGDDSEAIISTNTGEKLIIAANSLVVIKARKDSISIDIGFGSIEGKVGKGKKLLISSNNQLTELDGSDATVKIDAGDGDKLLLNVIEGEVEVRSADGITTLTRNDFAEVDSSGLTSPTFEKIQLLTPLADQRFRYAPELATQFSWKTKKRYSRTKIKVATDPQFRDVVINERVRSSSYVAFGLPQDQKLYWQVLAEGAQSQVGSFWLLEDNAPTPVLPQQGEQYFYDASLVGPLAGADIGFQWEGGSPARRYQLQISNTQLFTTIIKDIKADANRIEINQIAKGEYYWRVRGLEFPDAPWSNVAIFRVDPEPTRELVPPSPNLNDNQLLIVTKLHKESNSKFNNMSTYGYRKYIERYPKVIWSRVKNAEVYDLQISRTRSFRSPLISKEIYSNRFEWSDAEPGTYYWRVRSRGRAFLDGSFSKARKINVEVAPPIVLSESKYVDEVPDPILLYAPPPPLTVSWNPTVFSRSYEVILSSRPDFVGASRFVTASNERQIQLPKPGRYFWRVRALNKNNTPISSFSPVNELQFIRIYKDPTLAKNLVAISPKQGESILLVGQGQSEIVFEWNKPFKKASYELELSYDLDFESIAYRVKTPNTRVSFEKPLGSSIVYWRVRGVTNEGRTPWTASNRFLVSYESTPFDLNTSEKIYLARKKARERQQSTLAAIQRKLNKLRAPAGSVDIQLDTPILSYYRNSITVDENKPSNLTSLELTKLSRRRNYSYVKNKPVFSWKKVNAAERYFVEIARDPEFNSIVIKAPSFNPYYLWETVRPGRFYWRVQAFNPRYTRSQYSKIHSLVVKTAAPIAISPDNFVEVFNEPQDMWPSPAPFHLQWTPRLFAKSYQVEFSEDADFKVSKVFDAFEAKREFRVSKVGTYFWRVRAVNEVKVGIGPWSTSRAVEIAQAKRTPASVNRITGLFPLNRTMLYVGQGLMNLVFHFVSPRAQETVVEVATDPDFNSIVATGKADGDKLRITKDLPEGMLYWRAGDSRSADLRSPASAAWSGVYKFIIKKEPEPYLPEEPARQK